MHNVIPPPLMDPAATDLLAVAAPPRRAVFLDRDGVINVNHGYVHSADATEWVPGIFAACARAREHGYLLVVVTNQAGIARGYYDEATFLAYTRWMHAEFASRGVPLLASYYCPHHPEHAPAGLPDGCACRKPQPGMLLAARDAFTLDLGASVMLGDKPSDEAAARAAGVGRFVRVNDAVSPDDIEPLKLD